MKVSILSVILFLSSFSIVFSQELNSAATRLKTEDTKESSYLQGIYSTLKENAVKRYQNNHKMVIEEINKQAAAICEIIDGDFDNSNIGHYMVRWNTAEMNGEEMLAMLDKLDKEIPKSLNHYRLSVDWTLVLYELKKLEEILHDQNHKNYL